MKDNEKKPSWSSGNTFICETLGHHGTTQLTSCIDPKTEKVRIIAFCLCCGEIEELRSKYI